MSSSMSVRKPRVQKNHIQIRLSFFSVLTAALLLATAFAEDLCPYDPYKQDMTCTLQPPGTDHLMGTDRFGRDLLSRVLIGGRTSIFATLILVMIIFTAGTAIGIVCGFFGGKLDEVIMRISDVCLAIPGLVFALAIAAILDGGIVSAVIALAVISWPKYSRVARSQTLAQKESPYMQAARLAGDSGVQLIVRHILPNILGPLIVTAMLDMGTMMMELAGLSFLGLGAQPPTAEWGNMMSVGRSMLQLYPWLVIFPGIAIFGTVVLFNLLGEAVRDYLDPQGTYTG